MRCIHGFAAMTGLMLALASPAAENDVKPILDKAIKAHGGEEVLNKFLAVRLKLTAKFNNGPVVVTGNREMVFLAPDKYKHVIESVYLTQPIFTSWVIDGSKAYTVTRGRTADSSKPVDAGEPNTTALKDDAHLMRILQLTPLKGTGFELSPIDEIKVDDRSAVGLRARTKGQRDVNLYFDKDSGLLVKAERKAIDLGNQKEVTEERFFLDYKQQDGQPAVARKILVKYDGKDNLQLTVNEAKFLEKLDPREFAK